MTDRDERLGHELRALDVPAHGSGFYSRLAQRLDQEPPRKRGGRHRPTWLRPPMLLGLASVAAALVAVVAMSTMFAGSRPDVLVEVGGGTTVTGLPATPETSTPTTSTPTTSTPGIASAPVTTTPATTTPTPTAPEPTTPKTTTPTTTLPATTIPPLPDSPAGYPRAAYDAWSNADRTAAARVAQPAAVDALFARTWSSADGWAFVRCEGAAGTVVCVWQRPGEELVIRAPNSAGGVPVTEVLFRASP